MIHAWNNRFLVSCSSGKSSLMSTVSTPLAPTMATAISNWRGSTCTTTRPPEANMFPEPFSSIWNPVPWTLSAQDHTDKYSAPITLFSVNLEQETTGPRVTTQKVQINCILLKKIQEINFFSPPFPPQVPSLSTLFWTLSVRNQNPAIVFKDSNWHTHWEAVPDPVWELFLSPKSARNTPTESWIPTL